MSKVEQMMDWWNSQVSFYQTQLGHTRESLSESLKRETALRNQIGQMEAVIAELRLTVNNLSVELDESETNETNDEGYKRAAGYPGYTK